MRKLLLSLNSVRAIRELRAGASRRQISEAFGISPRNIDRIESAWDSVPDQLLAGIERLLADRERLRRLVSNLMHRGETPP
jgi:hypothetical protein